MRLINTVHNVFVGSIFVDSVLALLVGACLGIFYFAGLWWTVRKLGSSQQVALLFLCSMLVRTSIVIAGFYFILGNSWQQLLVGLLGFICVRIIATRSIWITEQSHSEEKKTHYAP